MIWKSCVTRLDARARRLAARQEAGEGWWPFAFTILGELHENWRVEDEPVLNRIYKSITAGTGIYKMTHRNRFPELDEAIAKTVGSFAGAEAVRIHDVAASNAITSLDLLRTLDRCLGEGGPANVELLATDKFDRLDVVALPGADWEVVFDVDHRALQVVGRRIVLSGLSAPLMRHPFNWIAHSLWADRCIARGRAHLERGEGVRSIPLFHPESVNAARYDSRFRLGSHDVFRPTSDRFHIVRVMNLLTARHLPEADVRRGLRAAAASVVEGGVVVFGRTMDDDDGRPRVTAFRILESEIDILWELNGGAENRELLSDPELFIGEKAHVSCDA